MKKKLVKKPTSLRKRVSVKRKIIKKKPARPSRPAAPLGLDEIPTELSHSGLFCPGCFHKVETHGTLLRVKNRGKLRWCLSHNAHVAMTGENSEIVTDAGEYKFKGMAPSADKFGNLITAKLEKINVPTSQ